MMKLMMIKCPNIITSLIHTLNGGYVFGIIFSLLILFYSQHSTASEFTFHLSSEQWSKPRSVNSILELPAISSAMRVLSLNMNNFLTIHHPGGDEGSLWALELRAWLISLGLSASRIKIIPGSSSPKLLDLEIISTSAKVTGE